MNEKQRRIERAMARLDAETEGGRPTPEDLRKAQLGLDLVAAIEATGGGHVNETRLAVELSPQEVRKWAQVTLESLVVEARKWRDSKPQALKGQSE